MQRRGVQATAADETLGIYMHVPFCRHACPYCDFYKLELRDRPARARLEFPDLLAREWGLLRKAHPGLAQRTLATIYLGGGTPSTLVPRAVGALVSELRGSCATGVDGGPEVTLEANPENLTPARAAAWLDAGVNRVSMGVQSFAPRQLSRLERLHGPETIRKATLNLRAAGCRNLSVDLMFALPGQTAREWMDDLARAVDELQPEHLSFYGLTIHEETPFDAEARAGRLDLPCESEQADMYERGAEFLESRGFRHYEISNFARPGFESRHNRRYWSRGDVVGLGPSAHSSLGASRWANPADIDAWRADVLADRLPARAVEDLSEEGRLEEALFCNLRRAEGVLRIENPELFARVRAAAASMGAAFAREHFRVGAGGIALTRRGWLVSDAIISRIAAHRPR